MFSAALDHVWQSTLFAVAILVVAPLLRHQSARARFWLWFAASAKFLFPFALLTAIGVKLGDHFAPATAPLSGYPVLMQFTTASFTPLSVAPAPAFDWQALAILVWLAGACGFALRWLVNGLRVHAILDAAEPAPIHAQVPVCVTTNAVQPALTGVFHPRILLPRAALAGLSAVELDAVLAHEVCHWRHRDHLWSVVHRVVEVLFWFHPLVWWLGGQLNKERERACDEAVLRAGFAPRDYAASLLRVCALHLYRPALAAGEMAGADLKDRIDTILARAPALPFGPARKLALASAALTCLALPICAGFAKSEGPIDADIIHSDRHPPSEAVLRAAIADLQKSTTSKAVSPDATGASSFMLFRAHRYLGQWGTLKALTFSHTDAQKDDQYEAVFARGRAYFVVHPTPDGHRLGKMDMRIMVDRDPAARPHPGTETALRRFIMAMEAGTPDYADMTPDFSAATYRALPTARFYLRRWGPLQSIAFLARDDGDLDVYRVRFARGWSDWRISALSGGKIWNMRFWGVSTGPGSTWRQHK